MPPPPSVHTSDLHCEGSILFLTVKNLSQICSTRKEYFTPSTSTLKLSPGLKFNNLKAFLVNSIPFGTSVILTPWRYKSVDRHHVQWLLPLKRIEKPRLEGFLRACSTPQSRRYSVVFLTTPSTIQPRGLVRPNAMEATAPATASNPCFHFALLPPLVICRNCRLEQLQRDAELSGHIAPSNRPPP